MILHFFKILKMKLLFIFFEFRKMLDHDIHQNILRLNNKTYIGIYYIKMCN